MKPQEHTSKKTRRSRPARRLAVAMAALLCLGLLAASPASAAFEQVDTFAGTPGALHPSGYTAWPEEVQLGGASGMAVNYTGAGGVPAGTLYAATVYDEIRVARYNPDGSFSEAWTFKGTLGGAPEERCGPEGDPAHPHCTSQPDQGYVAIDVDVDQSTGYVYVLGLPKSVVGRKLIHVYTPDGSKLLAEFGEQAPFAETIAESPAKIHEAPLNEGIAVNSAGDVYVFDQGETPEGPIQRLMKFEPQSPGDYEHYVYSGQSHDIVGGREGEKTPSPARPVADAAGDLYVVRESVVAKLDPGNPADPLLCSFKFPTSGIDSIGVDPLSGEVFFHSNNFSVYKKIYRLEPCDEASGKFKEGGTISVSPARQAIGAIAFDPLRQLGADRPEGVLYVGSVSGQGGKTEGEPPDTLVESSLGYVFAHPVETPPAVESESVANVGATTATLGAQINPKGQPTSYLFQYLTEAQYEANEPSDRFAGSAEAPLGGGLLGEGNQPLSAAASLSGLQSDTAYRFRAVATSHCSEEDLEKVCKGVGAGGAFRTFPLQAPGLADHRAYELVSPAQKEGGQVLPADPGISSCGSEAICKPGSTYAKFRRQVSADGEAIAYEGTPFSGQGAAVENEYLARRDAKAGWQTTNLTPPLLRNKGGPAAYYAFDAQLSKGLLGQQSPSLSPEAPSEYADVYAQPSASPASLSALLTNEPPSRTTEGFRLNYTGASEDLSRVFLAANDALSGETPFAPEAQDGGLGKFNLYEWHEGALSLVNVMPGNAATEPGAAFGPGSAHAVSAEGSRVFWEDEAHQVYVRENAESTLEIPAAGKFLSASVDGSRALLASGALYDLEAKATTDLSEGKGGFVGVVGESEDLSRIYFVDTAVLDEAPNAQGDAAKAGGFNLYVWTEAEGARFVATLVAADNNGGAAGFGATDWASLPAARTAQASPGGRYLSFISQASLTGHDNVGPCEPDHAGGFIDGLCSEAFLYDSATGELTCASCNPTGLAPLGWSILRLFYAAPSWMPQAHYLTDEGRLYFDSRDSLSLFDTNEGVEDVYQYEPGGVGTCERQPGCVSLISAGTEPVDSNLLAVDATGKNVFFTTRDKLVLKDTDDLIDLYVAREGGGIPGESEVSRGECQGEACQPLYSAPNDPTPGSSTFEGAGNVDEKKVAKKQKKAKKRKHAKKQKAKKSAHQRAAKHNRGGSK